MAQAADSRSAASLLQSLEGAYEKNDFGSAKKVLARIKVTLARDPTLQPGSSLRTREASRIADIARSSYEVACMLSATEGNASEFERHFALLNGFYVDYAEELEASPREGTLRGLNLLCLLSQGRIDDFHAELERLTTEQLQADAIRFVVEIEQCVVEGSYRQVLRQRSNPPHPSYATFLDKLSHTVRDEIASCCEVAYESLSSKDAIELLGCANRAEFAEFAAARGWDAKGDSVSFARESTAPKRDKIPAEKTIKDVLHVARALDAIV